MGHNLWGSGSPEDRGLAPVAVRGVVSASGSTFFGQAQCGHCLVHTSPVEEVRYTTTSDGISIAYQVVGSGPVDLITALGSVTHLEVLWEHPLSARYLRNLARFSRLILFDKRGVGLSDRDVANRSLEARMDDLRAVAAEVGARRPVVLGVSEGGPMAALYAATYPEETSALVVYGSMVRGGPGGADPDAPVTEDDWAAYRAEVEDYELRVRRTWGDPRSLELLAPSMVNDAAFRAWMTKLSRYGSSPSAQAALSRMNGEIDVRGILPSIRVPTLVLHRTGDLDVPVANGRYLASHVPRAHFVELEGADHLPMLGDADALVDEIEMFVTGTRTPSESDRLLTTLVFTDIVGSTESGSRLGDHRWRDLLETHSTDVRRSVARFRGVEIKATGDGFLARFDGPARAVRFALEVVTECQHRGLMVRAGVHTGEVELIGSDVTGIAVNLCQRVQSQANPGEVLASSTVRDLVAGSGLRFVDRGEHTLKGIPEPWKLYAAAMTTPQGM